jgi:hypothetical protein
MRSTQRPRPPLWLVLFAFALLPLLMTGRLAAQTIPGPEPPQETEVPTAAVPTPITDDQPASEGVGDTDLTFDVITGSNSPTEAQVTIRLSTLQNLTDCRGLPVNPDRVEISPIDPAVTLPLTGDLAAFGDVFRVQIYDKNNQVVCGPNLTPPALICIVPTAEQLAVIGGIENARLFTNDELIGGWRPLATRVIGGNRVCAAVTSFSLFRQAAPLVAQNVPAAVPQPTAAPVPRALPDTAGERGGGSDWLTVLLVAAALLATLWLVRAPRGIDQDG